MLFWHLATLDMTSHITLSPFNSFFMTCVHTIDMHVHNTTTHNTSSPILSIFANRQKGERYAHLTRYTKMTKNVNLLMSYDIKCVMKHVYIVV